MGSGRPVAGDEGLTLVEMLMAILILGVLFAGTAGALISFSQASVNNERRVQATATLNRLHEELQALRWEDAVLYENEVNAVPALDGLDLAASPPTFDGEPLVLLGGPDPACVSDCRIDTVPEPHHDPLTPAPSDGRDYEVYRLVTWVDRDGAPEEGLKRFTTVVRWEIAGRTVEQRFDSERAPTPSEVSDGDPSLQFLVTPSELELDDDGTNAAAIEFNADFALLGSVTAAEVRFESIVGGTPIAQTVSLAKTDPLSERFTGQIPIGEHEFPLGSQTFELVGTGATSEFRTNATVTFVEPGDLGYTEDPPTITQVNVMDPPMTRVVGRIPPDNHRLCSSISLAVHVEDAVSPVDSDPDNDGTSVTANYLGASSSQSVTLGPPASITEGATNIFTYEFPAGSNSPWRPDPGSEVTDTFKIVAQNPGSGPSTVVESAPLTFTYSTKNNERC